MKNKILTLFIFILTAAPYLKADTIVPFHIVAGTGRKPWNTRENPARVKVGQTLRIFNDDQIAHYLHTPEAPCPHGDGPFGPGESYDCVVSAVADPDSTLLYDHQFGSRSRFYVEATE